MPTRLQLKRSKGWRLPAGAVNVARPGRWGNPFRVEIFGRELAIRLFKRSLDKRWSVADVSDELAEIADAAHHAFTEKYGARPLDAARAELQGHDLACWCKLEEACHADVLLEAVNSRPA